MWWKIYFWILLILSIIGFVGTLSKISSFTLADWRGAIESIIVVMGVYSFVFQKNIIASKNWLLIFWYLVIAWSLDIVHSLGINFGPLDLLFKITIVDGGFLMAASSILLAAPGLYTIYKLSLQKK